MKYKFTAKGRTPDGNKWRCEGTVTGEDDYAWSVFEAAADVVEREMGVRPDLSNEGVTLQRLKPKRAAAVSNDQAHPHCRESERGRHEKFMNQNQICKSETPAAVAGAAPCSDASNETPDRKRARENWELCLQQAALVQKYKQCLEGMMVGQQFNGGGHITKRVAPTHSAVIKAKMLLDSQTIKQPNEKFSASAGDKPKP